MSILDTLVTDRTSKGYYGIEDLNRVAEAMRYVAERLRSCGWDVKVVPKGNWKLEDMVPYSEAKRLLTNLRRLRETLALFNATPPVPGGERPFNAEEANNIEKILLDIEDMVQRTIDAYFFSGDLYAGEV